MLTGFVSSADKIRDVTGGKMGRGVEMLTGFGLSADRIRDVTGVQMGRGVEMLRTDTPLLHLARKHVLGLATPLILNPKP